MANKDIISQLRDLQSVIDDFTDLKTSTIGTTTSVSTALLSSENYSHHEKEQIEEKQKSLLDSVLPFQLSDDDDFSTLLDQLNEIQIPTTPIDPTPFYKYTEENDDDEDDEEDDAPQSTILPISPMTATSAVSSLLPSTTISPTAAQSKIELDDNYDTSVQSRYSNNDGDQDSLTVDTSAKGEKHWTEEECVSTPSQPRLTRPAPSCYAYSPSSSVSRTISTLSVNSKRSIRSYKSSVVGSSGKQRSVTSSSSTKYHPRTYDEMMRIPDIHERIKFYEKTFQLCIRSDSMLAAWIKKVKVRGVPQPMLEGYTPPPRPVSIPSSSSYMSLGQKNDSTHFKMSTSLSGSISMFLRKASTTSSPGYNNHRYIPATPEIPKGISRSFGRQGLDRHHRLAHSMHWSTLQPPPSIDNTTASSFSPTPSLRHQHYRHRQNQNYRYKSQSRAIPSRIPPIVDHPMSSPSVKSLSTVSSSSPSTASSISSTSVPWSSNKTLPPSPLKSLKKQRSMLPPQTKLPQQHQRLSKPSLHTSKTLISTPVSSLASMSSSSSSLPFSSKIPRQSAIKDGSVLPTLQRSNGHPSLAAATSKRESIQPFSHMKTPASTNSSFAKLNKSNDNRLTASPKARQTKRHK